MGWDTTRDLELKRIGSRDREEGGVLNTIGLRGREWGGERNRIGLRGRECGGVLNRIGLRCRGGRAITLIAHLDVRVSL